MTDQRFDKLEASVTRLADIVGDFVATESARKVRDEHQSKHNEKVLEFIDSYSQHDKPVIDTSRRIHNYLSHFIGKVALPVLLAAILFAAGAQIYEKASQKTNVEKSES